MTALEEFQAPTCPLCATTENVERCRHHWLCGECWTVFTGGQGEWNYWRDARELRKRRYDNAKEHAG